MTAIGRLRISPADIGRRVSVRHMAGTDLTDVLGHLISWSQDWPDGVIEIRKKDDSIIKIVSGNIIAAKVIEPEIGALDLARESEKTWVPKEKENLGDWVLRFSGNESARANSCRLDGRPENSVDESLTKIIDWYKSRKAAAIVQSPWPGAFDESLKRNNFMEIVRAYYMISATQQFFETEVIIEKDLTDLWLETAMNSDARTPRLSKELLVSGNLVRFASIMNKDKKIIATGRIAASSDLAMATTVWVEASLRGTGLAKKIMKALSNEMFNEGHKHIVLQVLKSNTAAIGLYESIGYKIHHEYAYYRHSRAEQANEVVS